MKIQYKSMQIINAVDNKLTISYTIITANNTLDSIDPGKYHLQATFTQNS